ncbi:hypothetical protein SAMN04488134_1121 [Amphibacillus marinus]|uniref:Uncharacterized protein n=1 Tax=Amphibacillus marinus TaxID=872970 RepID=A0A1H8S5U2_9BACI|nr:hypothetical protein [Amphibacillus marinus]SEO73982.1 hypothetical protein SAMN04488134_1121 [Amphibacillus marinus]
MLGLLVSEREVKEIEYLIKRELEEILFDIEDSRIDSVVKDTMQQRYRVLYQLFRRIASHQDVLRYLPRDKLY